MLKYLKGGVGIPDVHYFYMSDKYNFMVIDLLGASIEDLFNYCKRKFSLKTILLLSEQMVIIRFLNSKLIKI